jgi:dihydrofolate synthase/folylpolyglutamate synthase
VAGCLCDRREIQFVIFRSKMTYPDAIQFLYDLRWFGTKLGLTNTFKLAALAGNPQHDLRFIHVAGTNGKGSTCAMLESIYRAAGLRVGLFTSPHLVSFGERMQVNRQCISEPEVVRLVGQLKPLLSQFSPDEHPTFFEVITVIALRYFCEKKCDLVVWETGLGGRLDSTNIVNPLVSVITNVDYDHQEWLGENLSSIAFEKAGIIKPGIPVVTAADKPEALEVIKSTARERHSPLITVSAASLGEPPLDTVQLPLAGRHQRFNAALAVAVVQALQSIIPVSSQTVIEGLSRVNWLGRLQIVTRASGQKILLDGAHNLSGAESLKLALEEYFPAITPALVLGVLADKDWLGICRALAPLGRRIILVPVASERTASPAQLEQACREANPESEMTLCQNLADAFRCLAEEPFVLVTGSLYLIGEALEILGNSPPRQERALNEWSASSSGPEDKKRAERV